MTKPKRDNSNATKKRFERDAAAFNAIYDDKSEFSGWFNKSFRKPIFERYEITFEALGNLANKSVIDVGCGSGVYSTQFAVDGAASVKGVDFSEPMLEIARRRAKSRNVTNICTFESNDFLKTSNSEKFNFSVAMGVFDYLTDPLTFLKKLKAVTNERVVASFPGHSLIRGTLRKLRYLFTSKGSVYFYSRKDIEKLVAKVGFRNAEIRPIKSGSGFVLIADV